MAANFQTLSCDIPVPLKPPNVDLESVCVDPNFRYGIKLAVLRNRYIPAYFLLSDIFCVGIIIMKSMILPFRAVQCDMSS